METVFLDTSALVKLYVAEPGSDSIKKLLANESRTFAYISELTILETTSAILRRSRGGDITETDAGNALNAFDRHLANNFYVLELKGEVISQARLLIRSNFLRSADAIQLATALSLNQRQIESGLPGVRFISADNELIIAANENGLLAENPSK